MIWSCAAASSVTQIPYRCLLPKGVTNLLAVGRCVCVEREVLDPVRVIGPCIAMAEAAGIATALAAQNNTAYKNVHTDVLCDRIREYGGYVDRCECN